jgi:hypothetical protein
MCWRVGMSNTPPVNVVIHWQSVNAKSSSGPVQITGSPISVTSTGISNPDGLRLRTPTTVQPAPLAAFAPVYVQAQKQLVTNQGLNKDSEGTFYVASRVTGVNTFWLFTGLQSTGADANSFQFFVYFVKNFHNSGNVKWTSLDPSDNSGWTFDFGITQPKTLTFTYKGTNSPTYLPWIEMTTTNNPTHSGIVLSAADNPVFPQAVFGWTGPPPPSPRPSRPPPSTSPPSRPLPSAIPALPNTPPTSSTSPSTSPSSSVSLGLPTWAIILIVVGSAALILGLGLGFGLRKKRASRMSL